MKKILIAAAVAALSATGANAADMAARTYTKAPPMAPVMSWTGFYVGVDVGGGTARQTADFPLEVPNLGQGPLSISLNKTGVLGGIHAGYNWQVAPSWLLGIEGDFMGADLGASGSGPNTSTTGAILAGIRTAARRTDWLASGRIRGGFLVTPTVLLYATGGVAFANLRDTGLNSFNATCAAGNCANFSVSSDVGYVVGGGVETKLWGAWSARAEYLYYNFEGKSQTSPLVGFPTVFSTVNFSQTEIHTGRVGVSYNF